MQFAYRSNHLHPFYVIRSMPFSLIPTPVLEILLDQSGDEQAIAEYQKLRELHCHLASHLLAIKQQTDASIAGIQSITGNLVEQVQTDGAAHFSRRRLE